MGKTHILGAGLGGLVAAVNLARAGREVLVIDAGKKIGGVRGFHPSLHVTPMDLEFVNAYTGLSVSDNVRTLEKPFRVGMWEDQYLFGQGHLPMHIPLYGIERGSRKTSLDSFLYAKAKELGVKFEFSTFVKSPSELPPDSIIATGLYPEMFDRLKIPFETVEGFYFTKRSNPRDDRDILLWSGDFSEDYYYSIDLNGLYYGLIFHRAPMDYGNLAQLEKLLLERDGEFQSWLPFTCRVPTKRFNQPSLFAGDHILGGSLTGMMDPLLLFGIHGALVSGKIAALAVLDRDRAEHEFGHLTYYYQRSWIMRRLITSLPSRARRRVYRFCRFQAPEFFKKYGYYLGPLLDYSDRGIPGFWKGFFRSNLTVPQESAKMAALFDKTYHAATRILPGRNIQKNLDEIKQRALEENLPDPVR